MKTRFHVNRCHELRTNFKTRVNYADIRILHQKMTFHTSHNISKRIEHMNDKQLPSIGLATSISQYSKNLGRNDLYENFGSRRVIKNHTARPCHHTSRTTLSAMRRLPIHTPSIESLAKLVP